MSSPTYTISPHPRGGAQLRGPGIRFPIWYDDECQAAWHAARRLGDSGGRIVFEWAGGNFIITEHVPACAAEMREALWK